MREPRITRLRFTESDITHIMRYETGKWYKHPFSVREYRLLQAVRRRMTEAWSMTTITDPLGNFIWVRLDRRSRLRLVKGA